MDNSGTYDPSDNGQTYSGDELIQPFQWERIQSGPNQELRPAYQDIPVL